ncbi:cytochrome c-type biogenesis protein [Litoreibacter roseus]|uniref:Cytochrome c-type biogenesis protein n=1 Tax=Litoreibacter roseus TaxID=2601869 RepID=A0A6N6JF27_9RHOB|nr:cytochrome c-type biogenesis protein [Litoreibacter roseus]GFE63979.1 cytochrome c biogenesis protein [Litoreibacter roseus]
MKRLLLLFCILCAPAFAVEPDEILRDPALEERARQISAQVRCVVCQNEPIDSSNAGVARDLRLLIRERLVAGDTDQQVYEYLVARYGDFVLFKPPFKPSTYALWIAPFLILFVGAGGVVYALSRRTRRATTTLSAEEEARIAQLLKDEPR